MAFADEQKRALTAKLGYRHVKTRMNNGVQIPYLEGWHAVAEANRIFGHDCWDRTTVAPRCLWTETIRGGASCFYTTKVRITVRAGQDTIVREGIGTGFSRSSTAELAHEIALKAAETDATKRALATFGNPFGLALYDKNLTSVTRPASRSKREAPNRNDAAFTLTYLGNEPKTFDDAGSFADAVADGAQALNSIDEVYSFWELNLSNFKALREHGAADDCVERVVASLKARVRALVPQPAAAAPQSDLGASEQKLVTIPREIRRRDKAHLRLVARQPCLICGRRPSHAHHIRFAQSRGLGLKVSDEFTVPLCASHHDALHRVGNEREWWARNGITDPLKFAERLWAASRTSSGEEGVKVASDRPETNPPQVASNASPSGPHRG